MSALREYLRSQGLTQRQFGEMIGCTQIAVARYCSGSRIPEASVMVRIHAATNGEVTPNDFFNLPDLPNPVEVGAEVEGEELVGSSPAPGAGREKAA